MRVISVANQKGGCGKTTIAVNLASALANAGIETLLIDNDPQAHATLALGVDEDQFLLSARDLYLTSDVQIGEVVCDIKEHLQLVPASVDLAEVEAELGRDLHRSRHLRERIAVSQTGHDVCIIDNPPHLGVLTLNALLASTDVLTPVDASRFGLRAVEEMRDLVEMIRVERGHPLELHVVANGFDQRTHFGQQMLDELVGTNHPTMLDLHIEPTVRLREAADRGVPVDQHDPQCAVTEQFAALAARLAALPLQLDPEEMRTWDEILHGPRRGPRGVVFEAYFPQARHVSVTGDFSQWSVEGHPLEKQSDGSWKVELDIEPGVFEYKFIVDGVWKIDPSNPECVRNSYGQLNSVLTVPAGGYDSSRGHEVSS